MGSADYGLEAYLIHRFEPGYWAAVDANYFSGGAQMVDGIEQANLQSNSRIGATLALLFGIAARIPARIYQTALAVAFFALTLRWIFTA